ncbi:SMI1/KNR4 family protein [Bradyrhizobium sp. JYMT SZCCT0180]|uniref:SMI1/KNR4 family protein n=1 Tax=Bradyrhizobium sp. JYMT SZCCT0180 TaxID=2807666 RepID=UPI001BA82279|nr:SMI1/KNR4 family protein [Bradyrhizobium sp. JYMT SZCCT0180]MBR1210532.1 SMI1/KNR4 family protein [Bradyrhizobium sp. JYMT SZCCT0180]
MYLAKFFHRPPGDDDRELLLIPGDVPIVLGILMREDLEPGEDQYLREEFSDMETAVAAFRRQAAELVAAGYMETTHTDYTLRNLLPDPEPKPDWQKGLDDLMLAALGESLEAQAKHLAALRDTPAANEPLYLLLAANHGYFDDQDDEGIMKLAERGRDTIVARRAARTPYYAWSIRESDLEARTLEVLSWAHLSADDPNAALEAIEEARRVDASVDRGAQRAIILVRHFPERQEEAFDYAYKFREFAGFEEIVELPAYADYVARRKGISESDKGWRWHTKKAVSESDLLQAEEELGARLPKEYREFLAQHGESELQVRLPDDSAELCFYRPTELATQRSNLFNFIALTEDDPENVDAYFREEYGVAARDLLPVAEPAHHSRCLVINLGQGERFGWCFQWDHDGAFELEQATPSFDAALKALTDGIAKRDAVILNFLGVYID